MKKILTMSLALMSAVIFVPSAQAKVAPANNLVGYNAEPQIRVQIGPDQRRQVRRQRVTTQTRDVRRGRNWYRETYQVRYLPNGRTQTRLISRVRISPNQGQIRNNRGQIRNNRGQIRNNRGYRQVATQTRDVRRGRNWYRETYQITYLPNGRTQTRLINRVRIR